MPETSGATTARRRRGAAQPAAAGTAPAAAPAVTAAAPAAQPQQPTIREAMRQTFVRTLLMYAMYQYYFKKPSNGTDSTPAPAPSSPLSLLTGVTSHSDAPSYYADKLSAAWPVGIPLEYRVFTSLDPELSFRDAAERGPEASTWSGTAVTFDTVDESYRSANITLPVPEEVRNQNATWYAHVFVGLDSVWHADQPLDEEDLRSVLYARHEIISWRKVEMSKEGKNLLGGSVKDDTDSSDTEKLETTTRDVSVYNPQLETSDDAEKPSIRYDQVWKPTLPIVCVTAKGVIILSQLPPKAASEFSVDEERKMYYPPMHVNEFWMLQDTLRLMNDTVKEVTIEMSFSPVSLYKWSLYKQFDAVWQAQIDFGAMKPHETDELKRMFIETNPWLLGTTMVVSAAHTILEVLAFKNDISHWKNIKSMEGVSVRTMIWKIMMEAIIFLYLWDNETSWMITIGNGVGVAIAIWKLGKAVKFENFGKRKVLGFIPWFDMVDRESYSKETKEYDDQAMKYLAYALYPLVIAYALYSLKYEKHKSWYSWVITSLVGAVYAFGFIMMFPQIFINYKLKSVAHLPMKAMMYKTLNTVIDDLFSFIIKMPWMHRLACFRDDVVFLIILYQRWIYPVDKKRVNEFGQQFDEDGEEQVVTVTTPGDVTVDKSSEESEEKEVSEKEESPEKEDVSGEEVKDATEKKND